MIMLCIVTPNPDSPAETYVRQHIRKIAAGNTVVLYFQGKGESIHDLPNFRIPDEGRAGWPRYLLSITNTIRHAYPGAIRDSLVERFLLEHKVQTILAEFGPTGCAMLPLSQKLGIRLVVNFHGHDATVMPRRWVIRNAYWHLNKHADAFVCGSQHFADVLIRLGFERRKINVIPCGIELDQFTPGNSRDDQLVLAVGRFVEKKAPHLTIRAFAKILTQCPGARLEMIGDGPLMPLCRAWIEENHLEEKIILHGAQSHEFVKQKLQKACLFIQHSIVASNGDTESQGISLLEAMACEVPVVTTRHNGFVETVQDGVTGFLVNEQDVNGMAERMAQILSNPTLHDRMGKAGHQRVIERYEANKIVEQLRALLIS